jgi:flagellar biosynthesis protein FliR
MPHQAVAAIKFFFLVLGVVCAVVLARRASKGDSIPRAAPKFVGVLVSTMPLAGGIQYMAFKSRAPAYAKSCIEQALFGLIWYVIIQILRTAA